MSRQKRFLPVLMALFVSLCPLNKAVADQVDADRHADAVQALVKEGDFQNALSRVDGALDDNKKNARLLLQRGLILVRLGRLDDAEKHYKKMRWRVKNNPERTNNLAMVYRMQGEYEDAIEEFRSTIKKHPDYARAYVNLGDTYIEMASNEYKAAYEAFPRSAILKSKLEASLRFDEIALANTPRTTNNQNPQQAQAKAGNTRSQQVANQASPIDHVYANLRSWITTWSEKEIDSYLSHYSRDFKPGNGQTQQQWIAQRRKTISGAEYIAIDLADINVRQASANMIRANFIHKFESNLTRKESRKSMTFERYQGDRWLITREVTQPLE